jgi:hypothetical protein
LEFPLNGAGPAAREVDQFVGVERPTRLTEKCAEHTLLRDSEQGVGHRQVFHDSLPRGRLTHIGFYHTQYGFMAGPDRSKWIQALATSSER